MGPALHTVADPGAVLRRGEPCAQVPAGEPRQAEREVPRGGDAAGHPGVVQHGAHAPAGQGLQGGARRPLRGRAPGQGPRLQLPPVPLRPRAPLTPSGPAVLPQLRGWASLRHCPSLERLPVQRHSWACCADRLPHVQADYSPDCVQQLASQQLRRVKDWRLDFELRQACKADVAQVRGCPGWTCLQLGCCAASVLHAACCTGPSTVLGLHTPRCCLQTCVNAKGEEDKDNAAILKCLAAKVDMVSEPCARQVSRSVRTALSFYQTVRGSRPRPSPSHVQGTASWPLAACMSRAGWAGPRLPCHPALCAGVVLRGAAAVGAKAGHQRPQLRAARLTRLPRAGAAPHRRLRRGRADVLRVGHQPQGHRQSARLPHARGHARPGGCRRTHHHQGQLPGSLLRVVQLEEVQRAPRDRLPCRPCLLAHPPAAHPSCSAPTSWPPAAADTLTRRGCAEAQSSAPLACRRAAGGACSWRR